MKILITGGAGFIGSHLCERLLAQGHDVSTIDDLNDFYPLAMKRGNLAAIGTALHFHEGDIRDEERVERIFAEEKPEAVIHLAARAGVRPSIDQALLYESVNVRGTMVLLEASRKNGVRKFLFASSSSIYGATRSIPFREDDWDTLPISPYAATKMAGEKVAYTYSHLYKLPVLCLRFFTVYGPRQRPDLAIRKFTEMIDAGRPIPLFGDGSSSRDYTYVNDTVQGILAALAYDRSAYDIFNLGNSTPIDLLGLVRLIEENLGKKAEIQWLPMQPGDVPITYADISKSKRMLGYDPQTPIAEGIRKFVEWYREQKL
ncbi:MAG TPA: GDP-mannose 4,6-dehydratase [Bryobacteraceae bacterium]|nr:GDP-mannose 4,6-dehydratase [Bryobacteraceae bacterium]